MTPLDAAHAAMETAPGDEGARLRFYERLAASELCLLLTREAEGDRIDPVVIAPEGGDCVLAFDNEARLAECQVVVAATGDDKVNLVVSLLAKTEFGVPRVVARVNHPKNEWMFDESWGVDVAVSTPRMLSALVEEAVSVGDLVRLFTFRQGAAELVEILHNLGRLC